VCLWCIRVVPIYSPSVPFGFEPFLSRYIILKKIFAHLMHLQHPTYSTDDIVYSAISDDIDDLVHLRGLMCRCERHSLNLQFHRHGELMSIGRIDNLIGALVVIQEWYRDRPESL
jgi:hypothetical protein